MGEASAISTAAKAMHGLWVIAIVFGLGETGLREGFALMRFFKPRNGSLSAILGVESLIDNLFSVKIY